MKRAAGALVTAVVLALSGCSSRTEAGKAAPSGPAFGVLHGQVATVGNVSIEAPLVSQVASVRGVSPRAALDAVTEDALLAQRGRADGLERTPEVSWATTSVLGRQVAAHALLDARDAGPPTADERSRLRVVHVLVMRSRSVPESQLRFAAGTLAETESRATSREDFLARVKALKLDVQTTAQELPPFDASGSADDGSHFDPDFVAGAFQLRAPGETSPVVESSFGWHVIRLLERLPPSPEAEAHPEETAEAVMSLRAHIALNNLLARRRQASRIDVVEGAAELTALATKAP